MAVHVCDEYDGDAARIWTDAADARELRANLAAVPGHPTLGDVDSVRALADYQAAKRAHKAEGRKSRAAG